MAGVAEMERAIDAGCGRDVYFIQVDIDPPIPRGGACGARTNTCQVSRPENRGFGQLTTFDQL